MQTLIRRIREYSALLLQLTRHPVNPAANATISFQYLLLSIYKLPLVPLAQRKGLHCSWEYRCSGSNDLPIYVSTYNNKLDASFSKHIIMLRWYSKETLLFSAVLSTSRN